MKRTRIEFVNLNEETVRQLKNELNEAKNTIIDLMPEKIQDVLRDFLNCESKEERWHWADEAAEQLVPFAKILPSDESNWYYSGERAFCPLCGCGSSSPLPPPGFAVPEGLLRHLRGYGNMSQCNVFKATIDLARDYWDKRFRASDLAEEAEKNARIAERRKTETLYRIKPESPPELINESLNFRELARDEKGLAWAEQRLKDLGFQIRVEENVKSYTREHGEIIVCADPRPSRVIEFRAYKRTPAGHFSRRYGRIYVIGNWTLFDTWKKNLRLKYEAWIAREAERSIKNRCQKRGQRKC